MSTNTSALNDTLEFPLWRPLLSISLSLFIGVLLPTTLFFNISVFVALVKSNIKHKPLLVLYGSLLLGLCVDKLLICVDQSVNSPNIIRYCACMKQSLTILAMPRVFFIVYSVVVVTCQSVLQLLVMKGRQEWQNSYKRSVGCLIVSAAVATFWTVLFFTSNYLSEFSLHCNSFCASSPYKSAFVSTVDASLFVFAAYGVFTLAPAFVVTIASSTLAFLVFRKRFMVKNNKRDIVFTRRLILLPVLMVFLLFCNSLLSYLVTIVSGGILEKANLGPFYGNWANYMSDLEYFVLDMLHALSYPLVLLYLYTHVKEKWKSFFSFKKQSCENMDSGSHMKDSSAQEDTPPNSSVSEH